MQQKTTDPREALHYESLGARAHRNESNPFNQGTEAARLWEAGKRRDPKPVIVFKLINLLPLGKEEVIQTFTNSEEDLNYLKRFGKTFGFRESRIQKLIDHASKRFNFIAIKGYEIRKESL